MKMSRTQGLLIIMIAILFITGFWLSGQDAVSSRNMTDGVLEMLGVITQEDKMNNSWVYKYHSDLFREIMHFVSYQFATMPILLLMYSLTGKLRIALPIAFCIVLPYSVFDEIHQGMVIGRGYQYLDLLLDAGGMLMAAFTVVICVLVIRNMEQRSN